MLETRLTHRFWYRVIKLYQRVKEHFGRVDAVVNSAGICENIPAIDYSAEKLHKLLAINLDGSFFIAREAAKMMIEKGEGGAVTLVGSMSGSIINVPQPQTPCQSRMPFALFRSSSDALAIQTTCPRRLSSIWLPRWRSNGPSTAFGCVMVSPCSGRPMKWTDVVDVPICTGQLPCSGIVRSAFS